MDFEIPEIEEGAEGDPFKRRVALFVVLVTLVGSFVGYLQTRASNEEEVAARTGQILGVEGLGEDLEHSSNFNRAFDTYVRSKLLERQEVSERRQGDQAEVERLTTVRGAIAQLSPLLSDADYSDDTQPFFEQDLFADRRVEANEARLRQDAAVAKEQDWGAKADGLVAVLTVLAVSLFLAGLSLTVSGRGRNLLMVPALVIAAACVVWAATIAFDDVDDTPDQAIEAVAEGDRLADRAAFEADPELRVAGFEEAIDAYTAAIDAKPDYAVAFQRRASAHFLAGSQQDVSLGFVSTTSDERLERSLADLREALDLGGDDDILVLASLGFDSFLAGEYGEAVSLSRRALELNDGLSSLWFNVAVAELAVGNEDAAEDAYREGIRLNTEETDAGTAGVVFSGARTDLEILIEAESDRADEARRFQAMLTAAQTESILGVPVGDAPSGVSLTDFSFVPEGGRVRADFRYENVPVGSSVAYLWYTRSADDQPFVELSAANFFLDFRDDGTGEGFIVGNTGVCPVPGEYRLDVYVEGERVASESALVESGVLVDPAVERDQFIGSEFCRPGDWVVTSDQEGLLIAAAPDDSAAVAVGSFLLSRDQVAEGALAVEENAVAGALAPAEVTDFIDFTFGGATGSAAFIDQPDGSSTGVAAFVGTDNVMRLVTVVVDDPSFFDFTDQILASLRFTDLPTDDPRVPTEDLFGPVFNE